MILSNNQINNATLGAAQHTHSITATHSLAATHNGNFTIAANPFSIRDNSVCDLPSMTDAVSNGVTSFHSSKFSEDRFVYPWKTRNDAKMYRYAQTVFFEDEKERDRYDAWAAGYSKHFRRETTMLPPPPLGAFNGWVSEAGERTLSECWDFIFENINNVVYAESTTFFFPDHADYILFTIWAGT